MALDIDGIKHQFGELAIAEPPTKRAAYSDRTAWMMAVLSQLAYERFEGTGENMLKLAAELARLGSQEKIATRLMQLSELLSSPSEPSTDVLMEALAAGGFELIGTFDKTATDTQGFVTVRKNEDEQGIVVLVFRGTQQIKDWKTNLDAATTEITGTNDEGNRVLGRMHSGFNAAYLSVRADVEELLGKVSSELPVYICGHSLGGALATVATWYLPGRKLAACYTFGAPRVGTPALMKYYRTPVYRVVSGMDPVPNVPPGGQTIAIFKWIVRLLSVFLSGVVTDWMLKKLVERQGYRHFGDIRYLTDVAEEGGAYSKLQLLTGVGPIERAYRFGRLVYKGEASFSVRVDKYHDMGTYRDKLRAYAISRR
ncbi:MAG: hypothetical protein DHS20C03_35550 [Minwuia thermotolerans]|nr:MAG: hypothetical protein DHS20C03_35550 [Minwuia thermotolerans]